MDATITHEGSTARRWAGRGARGASVAVAAGLLSLLVLIPVTGPRVLLVRSGSMEPTIGTGDVIVTALVGPSRVRPGDIVTFQDPSRANTLVTHRVVTVSRGEGGYDFVTRGDRNSGTERWSIAADGRLGKLRFRLPGIGYAVGWAGDPPVRAGLVLLGSLLVGIGAIRWIWRR